MRLAKHSSHLLAVPALFALSVAAPNASAWPYEVWSPDLPRPPFFGPGPDYSNNIFGGPGSGWIQLPSPGLVVMTPRGPVRVDSLPNGAPPTGGIVGVQPDGITGPRVVVPFGADRAVRVTQEFFGISDPTNGISFEAGVVDEITGIDGTDDIIGGDLTFTFDDGFSQTIAFPAGTMSFVGFAKTSGPDIGFVTISSSVGLPAIQSIGIGTVPEPASLAAVACAGVLTLRRHRRA